MARMPQDDPNDHYENNPSGDLLRGLDNAFFSRMSETVRADRKASEPFRKNLHSFTQQHVGNYYGDGGTGYDVHLPLISTFLNVHSRSLVPHDPRTGLVTFDEQMRPAVDAMENWQNEYFEQIRIGDTFRRCVFSALMTEGRLKIDLMPPEVAEAGYDVEAGQPYLCEIEEDDWACDMEARSYQDATYYAYKYYVPLEVAQDILDSKLHPDDASDYDEGGIPRMFTIGAGLARRDRIEDFVELWCVHLKRRGLILTMRSVDGLPGSSKKDVLRVRKYLGPKGGNILSLGYGTVPGNLRPLSPVMGFMPLHLAINRGYRKLVDTADNFKSVLPVRGGAMSKDGKAMKNASHMEIVNCDNPAEIGEKRFNLPPAELQLFVQDMRTAFDYIGGGLAALGGRAPSAPTATQEKIISGNAQAGVNDMVDTTRTFICDGVRVLNWYLWYHPTNVYKTIKQIPGQDRDFIQRRLYPYNDELPSHQALIDAQSLMRKGPMPRIRVDMYSLIHMTPQERSQFLTSIFAEMAPYAGIMGQQGYFPDFGVYLDLKAKFGDEPMVKKLYQFQGKPEQPEGEGGGAGLNKEISVKPAETTRNYTRHSAGGGNQQANDMRSQLMSAVSANGQG